MLMNYGLSSYKHARNIKKQQYRTYGKTAIESRLPLDKTDFDMHSKTLCRYTAVLQFYGVLLLHYISKVQNQRKW